MKNSSTKKTQHKTQKEQDSTGIILSSLREPDYSIQVKLCQYGV